MQITKLLRLSGAHLVLLVVLLLGCGPVRTIHSEAGFTLNKLRACSIAILPISQIEMNKNMRNIIYKNNMNKDELMHIISIRFSSSMTQTLGVSPSFDSNQTTIVLKKMKPSLTPLPWFRRKIVPRSNLAGGFRGPKKQKPCAS